MDIFSRDVTLAGLSKAMQAVGEKKELIAQNIANANTPGYQRRDIAFTEELARALETTGHRGTRTQAVMDTTAREVILDDRFYRTDMGGVDIDREMVEHAKASIYGGAVSQLLTKKIRQYRMVIKEGMV